LDSDDKSGGLLGFLCASSEISTGGKDSNIECGIERFL
jgi:hypothetical protein